LSLRKIQYTMILAGIVLMAGCAGRQALVARKVIPKSKPNSRSTAHFVDGVISDLTGNYEKALLSYQEAFLYDSTSSYLYLAVGKGYYHLEKQESALIALRKSLQLNPDENAARELIAKIYFMRREWDLAEESALEILSRDSSHTESYYNLALIYLQKNQSGKAADMYSRLLSLQPALDPQVLLSLGELFMELKRYNEAAGVYDRLIEHDPGEEIGYYGKGIAKEAMGDTSAAVESYMRALQLNPEMDQVRVRLSQIYRSRSQWEDAIQISSEAVKRDSTDIGAWLEIGELYRQKNDTTMALKTFQGIKRLFPNDWRSYLELGRFHLRAGKFTQAYPEFRMVVNLAPDMYWGWLFTGITLVHLDSLDQSQFYLFKAMDMAPDHPLGNYYLGSVLTQLDRSVEAVSYLNKACNANPEWVAAITALAGAYDEMEEYASSDSLYQKALKLEPDNALVLNNYGYSLSLRGIRLQEAQEMVTRALETDPENGAYLDSMGWIYFTMGDYEKALEYIKRAHALSMESVEVATHLGDVYEKLGMKEKAIEVWQEALKLDDDNQELLIRLKRKVE